MPVINKVQFSLIDATREVYYNNPQELADGVRNEFANPRPSFTHSLREVNSMANSSYFDPNYSGGNGLRRFRNYHKEDGIYLYSIMQNMHMYNMILDGVVDLDESDGSGSPAFPRQGYWMYRIRDGGQVYVTLQGFEGWHIPTEYEIDQTFAACGGINNAGFYLKQHPVIVNYPPSTVDYWLNSVERCPDYDRDLGLLPGGALNLITDQWVSVGEMGNYLYLKYDIYNTTQYRHYNWYPGAGYSSTYANRPIAPVIDSNAYYQGKSSMKPIKLTGANVFRVANNTNAITKTFLQDNGFPSTAYQIRLVRDPDFDMTSHTDLNGNTYETINIGGIIWMKQDLRVTQLGYTNGHRNKNLKLPLVNIYDEPVIYNDNSDYTPGGQINSFPETDFDPAKSGFVSRPYQKAPCYVLPYLGIQHFNMNLKLIKCEWNLLSGSQYAYLQTNFGYKVVQPYITHVPL